MRDPSECFSIFIDTISFLLHGTDHSFRRESLANEWYKELKLLSTEYSNHTPYFVVDSSEMKIENLIQLQTILLR